MDKIIVAIIVILCGILLVRRFYKAARSRQCSCCDHSRPSGSVPCTCGCGGTKPAEASEPSCCCCAGGEASEPQPKAEGEAPAGGCPYCNGKAS